MDVLCIKTTGAHWGNFYEKDKFYKYNQFISCDRRLILDTEAYFSYLSKIAGSIIWIRQGYTEGDIVRLELIEDYKTSSQIKKEYTILINLPFVTIFGEDSHTGQYCLLKRSEVELKYGSCKFDTSVDFLEDYFITRQEIRDNLIDSII